MIENLIELVAGVAAIVALVYIILLNAILSSRRKRRGPKDRSDE